MLRLLALLRHASAYKTVHLGTGPACSIFFAGRFVPVTGSRLEGEVLGHDGQLWQQQQKRWLSARRSGPRKRRRGKKGNDKPFNEVIEKLDDSEWLVTMKAAGYEVEESIDDPQFSGADSEAELEQLDKEVEAAPHTPVMLEQVVESLLRLTPANSGYFMPTTTFVDCTVGAGGHSAGLLDAFTRAGRRVHLVGIDQDGSALSLAKERLWPLAAAGDHELSFVRGNFAELPKLLSMEGVLGDSNAGKVDGVLADLGVSSMQLDCGERGFSFRQDAPLDMRMDQQQELTAWHVVNEYPESVLVQIFRTFGEVKGSARIARLITAARAKQPIDTTEQLIRVMAPGLKWAGRRRRWHHPATLPFQGIRMAVNDELRVLKHMLEAAPTVLRESTGVLMVISFHGLEDGMVKGAFKSDARLKATSKRPLEPTQEQCDNNPRCRSAKLRIAVRN